MDRRTILAVVLSVFVYYMWMMWVQATTPPVPIDSGDAVADVVEDDAPEAPVEEPEPVPTVQPTSDLPVRTLKFQACGSNGEWTTEGGVLRGVHLEEYRAPYDAQALWQYAVDLVTGEGTEWKPYGEEPMQAPLLTERAEALVVGAGELGERPARVEVVEDTPERLVLRSVTADGIEITRTIQGQQGESPCAVAVDVTWRNGGSGPVEGELWVGMFDHVEETYDRYHTPYRPTGMVDGSVETWQNTHSAGCTPGAYALEEPYRYEGPVQWLGLTNAYFSAVLLPEDEASGQLVQLPYELADGELGYGAALAIEGGLEPGASRTESFQMYLGANEVDTLAAVDDDLTSLVDFGMLSLFAWPLHWLLTTVHGLIGNWGLAIMALTFMVKLTFFPLTQMSFKSSQRMQAIQPELQKVREELKDNQEELNRRTMELFRENNVNPLGGCLPMLIQMPIWFALYQVLLYSVELYHTEFLYLRDLSSLDPYCILPALAVGLMLVQQQFMPTGNMDPAQARMMKMMPLIFGFFFFAFPSGLVLYILVNMMLTIAQQWYIKRRFGKPATPEPAAAT